MYFVSLCRSFRIHVDARVRVSEEPVTEKNLRTGLIAIVLLVNTFKLRVSSPKTRTF